MTANNHLMTYVDHRDTEAQGTHREHSLVGWMNPSVGAHPGVRISLMTDVSDGAGSFGGLAAKSELSVRPSVFLCPCG